jgi:hypothetical protein
MTGGSIHCFIYIDIEDFTIHAPHAEWDRMGRVLSRCQEDTLVSNFSFALTGSFEGPDY